MKPVRQTRYGYPDGNCFAACMASIFELTLEQVPSVSAAADDWWPTWQAWLAKRGLCMYGWPAGEDNEVPRGWALANTVPPEAPEGVGHSTVAFDGVIVHDPHPFEDPGPIVYWIAFGTLDPASAARDIADELAA